MAFIARTDGTQEEIAPPVTLKQAQQIVGGYVEVVRSRIAPDLLILCNEDGLSHRLPVNAAASLIGGLQLMGDVVVIDARKKREAKGWA